MAVENFVAGLESSLDAGVMSLIPAWSHTSVEIDCEIYVQSLSSLELLIQEGLVPATHGSMCAKSLNHACPGRRVVRPTDHLGMTIAVDWGVKP